MAGARILKTAGRRPVGDPFDRYVQLPLICIAVFRADGWPIAAYSHNTEPDAWCVKVRNGAVITVRADGALSFKGLAPVERERITAARDRALTVWSGLVGARAAARV